MMDEIRPQLIDAALSGRRAESENVRIRGTTHRDAGAENEHECERCRDIDRRRQRARTDERFGSSAQQIPLFTFSPTEQRSIRRDTRLP
ncbi:hypothetical protein ACIBEK_31620 [Nocardia fusca]|uniref:hypothetical protein n=1 Tax=Nocardia fusca TaxID=941183 RepID=UPI0037B8CD8A